MAKIRDIQRSGSVGPVVTQSGRFGQIQRQRVTPTNPKTIAQQNQRSILAAVSSEWRGLTDSQRRAWADLASQVGGNLTGSMMYVKVNATRVTCGQDKLEDAPLPPAFGIITCTGLTCVAGVITLVGVVDTVMPDKFMIEAASPVSAGITNRTAAFRLIDVVAGHTASADIVLTTPYATKFGVPTVGTSIAVRIKPVKDGFQGIPLSFGAVAS